MTRRDAIATLTAMPGLTRIEKADLKSTDVIVVEVDHPISAEAATRMYAILQSVWPDNKIVISDGARLKVVSGA